MDEMVPEYSLRYLDGPADIFHRLLVSSRYRAAEFLRRPKRLSPRCVGQRLRPAPQADCARAAQESRTDKICVESKMTDGPARHAEIQSNSVSVSYLLCC